MLYNTYEFIFAFVPLTLAGFYAIGAFSRPGALRWLILASLFFYAWWRPINVLIIAPSLLVNFVLARRLLVLAEDDNRRFAARATLILGIAFNIAFLAYFKYTNFISAAINDLFGSNQIFAQVILPLGISFITFQKIAFLIDVHAGRVKAVGLQDFCLFVLFFPQLIAGPIVHYREMMPQFQNATCRFDKENVSVGLTLFFMGLFKKVVLADNIATFVTPIFDQAAGGQSVTFIFAWVAAIGFTLQIYFDFSGYTDMALGAARLFGIRLPPNFNSPLKASSIIDFWLRWHMTLTRFLTAYIYNPLVLVLTRRRLASGRTGFGVRNADFASFATLLAFPTVLTMFISGLWHGAGYQFICWGLLHGFYLTLNHAWRMVAFKLWPDKTSYDRFMSPAGFILTFLAVAVSMVLFRSSTLGSALQLLNGMAGLNGVSLPAHIVEHLGSLGNWLQSVGLITDPPGRLNFSKLLFWIIVPLLIALLFPNTLQMLSRFEPALGIKPRTPVHGIIAATFDWTPSLLWAAGTIVIVITGLLSLGGPSEFLYWQF